MIEARPTEGERPRALAVPVPERALAPGRLGRFLKHLVFWLVVRPLVAIVLGLNVRHRERLPSDGPAILVANHNSHLDTLVLMALLPRRLLARVRPVAAADYFLSSRPVGWFALHVLGILPVVRGGRRADPDYDPLAQCREVLDRDEIVILFPEGTRGEAERRTELKTGIGHLALARPRVPVVPLFLHGLGKTLPKGTLLPVPFFCDVFVGRELRGERFAETAGLGETADAGAAAKAFVVELGERMDELAAEGRFAEWE